MALRNNGNKIAVNETISILSLGYAIYTIMNCYKNRSGVQNIIKEIKGENNE